MEIYTHRSWLSTIRIHSLQSVVDVVVALEITSNSWHDVYVHVLHCLACFLAILYDKRQGGGFGLLFNDGSDATSREAVNLQAFLDVNVAPNYVRLRTQP